MRRKKIVIVIFMLVASFFAFKGSNVLASQSLLDYPGIHKVNSNNISDKAIPGAYSTVLRYHPGESQYSNAGATSVQSGKVIFDRDTVKNKATEHYVLLTNVAVYQGREIDLKINVTDIISSKNSKIEVYTTNEGKNFLRIDVNSSGTIAVIDYIFLDHDSKKPIDFKGMYNYKRVNRRKAVVIDNTPVGLHDLYTYTDTALVYDVIGDNVSIIGTTTGEGQDTEFTSLFNTIDKKYRQRIELRDFGQGWVRYEAVPITKMELPPPQIIGLKSETFPEVKYTLFQDMPKQVQSSFYPKSYDMYMTVPESVDLSEVEMKVKNLDGTDVTAKFSIESIKSKNQFKICVKNKSDLSASNFVDNSYYFEIVTKLNPDNDLSPYYNAGYYDSLGKVYNEVDVGKTDGYKSETNEGTAKTKASIFATPIEQKVGEGTNTSDWATRPVADFFKDFKGAFADDTLKIKTVQQKTFNAPGEDSVKVTLVGSKSGIEKEFSVPVKVLGNRKIIVSYVDETGRKIKEAKTVMGLEGEPYDVTKQKVKIPGYNFNKLASGSAELTGNAPVAKEDVKVILEYKSVHFKPTLSVNESQIGQTEELNYTLDVKSGMVYDNPSDAGNYQDFKIDIAVDTSLEKITNIKLTDDQGTVVGIGTYDKDTNKITAALTSTVKDTTNLKLTFTAKVKDSAVTGANIVEKAKVSAKFKHDLTTGSPLEIKHQSNEVTTLIIGTLRLASAPSTIDFGKIQFKAREQRIENPTYDDNLVVSDTRQDAANGWVVTATLTEPMTNEKNQILVDAVRYKTADEDLILSNQAQEIYVSKTTTQNKKNISDDWGTAPGSQGVKLQLQSNDVVYTGKYTGKIVWQVMQGQP